MCTGPFGAEPAGPCGPPDIKRQLLKEQRHLVRAQGSLIACLGPSNGSCSASSFNTKGKAGEAGEVGDNYHSGVFFPEARSYASCHCVNVPATRETHNAPLSPVY